MCYTSMQELGPPSPMATKPPPAKAPEAGPDAAADVRALLKAVQVACA